ncbi:MAG TPA: hypothetical protein VK638_54695 [Edaphobacter sp.]|nr:hypothetical protein [Edaphobacter sp.]
MPTIIGGIFFIFGLYYFFLKEEGLLGLLIIASVFQASSAVNIAERGIQPCYVIATFIIARAIVNYTLGVRLKKIMPKNNWLLLFGVIAVVSAFILPVIFSGIPVYDPKGGIDEGGTMRPPLRFGLNNVAQAGFLIWHIVTVYALLAIKFSAKKTYKAYIWAFYLIVIFVAAQSICQLVGIPFPDSLIRNNPGYGMSDPRFMSNGLRSPGTFAEPSFAGAFLVFYCVGFMAEYLEGKGSVARVLVSIVANGIVASSGSLFALFLCVLALFVRYFPYRIPWYINIRRTKKLALISFVVVAPMVLGLLVSSASRRILIEYTVAKGDSSSFFNRTAADLYALQLLPRTGWIGVGLGSNRGSSLITTLLSNVGIVGVLAFCMFYFGVFFKLPREYAWYRWASFALFLNMCIDVPDVTFPMFWISIMLAVQFIEDKRLIYPSLQKPIWHVGHAGKLVL